LALLERRANERQNKGVQEIATNDEPFSALQERQVADIRTKPVQRKGARLEQLVTSPLQQERIQPVQNLPALSPARQQAVQDSWQRAAQPLYQALRPQLEALQQIQDPAQRRMTEAALERPFYLLWQEAVRRQTGPVAEGLMQQDGGNPSRLLTEAVAARFYDLLWEEMKGRSSESGGVPGIALLESGVMPRGADGDAAARRGVKPGSLPEKGAGGVADEIAKIAELNEPYPVAAEVSANNSNPLINQGTNGILDVEIDAFTPCLKDTRTGQIVPTHVSQITSRANVKPCTKKAGWNVNWSQMPKDVDIYALTIAGSDKFQGLIGIRNDPVTKAVYIHWASTAPGNNKLLNNGRRDYDGVGGHLIAIAIQKSIDLGYGGCVYGYAANAKVLEHYKKWFGAKHIGMLHPYHFIIDEAEAKKVQEVYTYEWK
jgi:hypothetical protein